MKDYWTIRRRADPISEMTQSTDTPPVLALVSDLMFSSKITGEARAAGQTVTVVRSVARLVDQPASLLLVDCNMEGAIESAGQWRQRTGGRVVGFVSHMDTAAIQQAKAVGFDHVYTRGQFVGVLPTLFAR